MNYFWERHNLVYRICASILIILHVVAFGPIRDVFAFSAQSVSYRLNSGTPNGGGGGRVSPSYKLYQDSISEVCIGKSQSASYVLYAGYVPIMQSNQPEQTQTIVNQSWRENQSLIDAFDLDDYFTSDLGVLTYTVSGNTNIIVDIAIETKLVSFSQPEVWQGAEEVVFIAT
ncbi:MAG: hypothetical protein ABIH19_00675, partial [Candidatus Omnitrophota bacterium]